jgi:murein DD-endopeptidase MepM/ murein hydrolase activator NlpD
MFVFISKNKYKLLFLSIILIIVIGFIPNQKLLIPVKDATSSSYNAKSFWYNPWGKSGTHKGVDIFANIGTKVIAPCDGIIIKCGKNNLGGNYVVLLSSKWRFHYFAHLSAIYTKSFTIAKKGTIIAAVGDTGNARGKAPHLHYEIHTLIPYIWQVDTTPQGYKKMWYINPIKCFEK